MTTATILDIVVILLLVPTIIYAVILNRRLAALRRSRDELSKVVNSFNEATMRAEAGIPKLKKATTEANQTLKERVDKAQTLRDDLAFMIERAEELAARLENAVRSARAEGIGAHAPAVAAAAPSRGIGPGIMGPGIMGPGIIGPGMAGPAMPGMASGVAAGQADPRSALSSATLAQTAAGFEETAAELRNALGAARAEARVSGPATAPVAAGLSRGKRTLGERSDRIPERAQADRMPERQIYDRPAERPSERAAFDDERSEAERELLKALQSAR